LTLEPVAEGSAFGDSTLALDRYSECPAGGFAFDVPVVFQVEDHATDGASRHTGLVGKVCLCDFVDNARPNIADISSALNPVALAGTVCPDSRRLQATWRRNRYLAGTPLHAIWYLSGRDLPFPLSGLIDPVTALTVTELETAAQAPQPTQLELRMWGH